MRISSVPACIAAMALAACSAPKDSQELPSFIEPDSITAINYRLARDFSLPFDKGAEQIIENHPELTADSIRVLASKGYIETMEIDGQLMMHRKAVRNFDLLNPAYNGGWTHRGCTAKPDRIAYADSVIKFSKGKLPEGGARRVKMRFCIDVPANPALEGDTLRVWMPYPLDTDRQTDVTFISASQPDVIITEPGQSVHNTIYFEQPASPEGNHFEYVAEFTAHGAYFSPQQILKGMKPYDTESDIYKKYTAFDGPHYVRLDSLAAAIVGDETNPFRQSELVYDYIVRNYPWAGAREYSTIPCLPEYVVETGHGDCGQVALLYISLMRTLGVPSRWESGWMLHPGEKNLHDWAETYYEGIGWVPVDVSFGRYTTSDDPAVQNFYSTGIDTHRFVANKGVNEPFYPAKTYLRSETVDSQMGEVECSKGNLFYPGWDCTFELISSTPVK